MTCDGLLVIDTRKRNRNSEDYRKSVLQVETESADRDLSRSRATIIANAPKRSSFGARKWCRIVLRMEVTIGTVLTHLAFATAA
jgi:hypothetical protein